jgi:hypothetical protein
MSDVIFRKIPSEKDQKGACRTVATLFVGDGLHGFHNKLLLSKMMQNVLPAVSPLPLCEKGKTMTRSHMSKVCKMVCGLVHRMLMPTSV